MKHLNLLLLLSVINLYAMAQNIENGVLRLDNLKKIEYGSYWGANNFTEVTLSPELEEIEAYAFFTSSITEVHIPGTTKKIGERAFADCPNLTKVVLEDGVEEIGLYAFYNDRKNFEITIPASVTKFADLIYYGGIAHVIEGSEAHKYAMKIGLNYDFYGTSPETEHAYLNVESLTKKSFENCKNLKQIDISINTTKIEDDAIPDGVTIRCYRDSYADSWAKSHGYVLCGVLGDVNCYTKDQSKRIEENFTRIMCDNEKLNEISEYEFNLTEPLQIKNDENGCYLYSYMLEPASNVNIVLTTNGEQQIVYSFDKVQPLTKTHLNLNLSKNANLSIQTDDELYNKIHSLKVDWHIRFSDYTEVDYERDQAAVKTYVCREWISILTKMATTICDDRYKERMKNSVGTFYSNYEGEPMNYLDLDSIMSLYDKMFHHDFEIGLLLQEYVLGRAAVGSNYIAFSQDLLTKSQYEASVYLANAYFHEYSHNMGYNHEDGNMCGNSTDNGYSQLGATLYVEMLEEGSLPYSSNHLLNTAIFSKQYIYDFDDEATLNYHDDSFENNYYISNDTLYIREGVKKIAMEFFKDRQDFKVVVLPSTLTEIGYGAFQYSSVEEVEIPSNVKFVEERAFADCPNLKHAVVKDGVETIGRYAFYCCNAKNLIVELPRSLSDIGDIIVCRATFYAPDNTVASDYVKDTYGKSSLKNIVESTETIELKRGWNLISFNIDIDDRAIASIFKNIDIEQIRTDSLYWNKHQSDVFNTLKLLTPATGYLIFANEDATLNLYGNTIENISKPQLAKGWNLVGSQFNYAAKLSEVFPEYQISAVRDLVNYWDEYNSDFANFEIQPTKAYYIYVK